jgi:hypothetical protein
VRRPRWVLGTMSLASPSRRLLTCLRPRILISDVLRPPMHTRTIQRQPRASLDVGIWIRALGGVYSAQTLVSDGSKDGGGGIGAMDPAPGKGGGCGGKRGVYNARRGAEGLATFEDGLLGKEHCRLRRFRSAFGEEC